MLHTISLLLDALTDAADDRLTHAALLGRSHAQVERDMLAATGLSVETVRHAVNLAIVRRARRCAGCKRQAFVAAVFRCTGAHGESS